MNVEGCERISPTITFEKIAEAAAPYVKMALMKAVTVLVHAVAIAVLDKYAAPACDLFDAYVQPKANPENFFDLAANCS